MSERIPGELWLKPYRQLPPLIVIMATPMDRGSTFFISATISNFVAAKWSYFCRRTMDGKGSQGEGKRRWKTPPPGWDCSVQWTFLSWFSPRMNMECGGESKTRDVCWFHFSFPVVEETGGFEGGGEVKWQIFSLRALDKGRSNKHFFMVVTGI